MQIRQQGYQPYSNNTFKGLHVDKRVLSGLECTKDLFLKNPCIKECADKYEVVVKRGKCIGSKEIDPIMTLLGTIGSAAVGCFIGACTYIARYIENAATASQPFPILISTVLAPIIYNIGNAIYHNKSKQYEYVLQAGKKIDDNQNLSGAVTQEYTIKNNYEIFDIEEIAEEVYTKDKSTFETAMNQYKNSNFNEAQTYLNILQNPVIRSKFSNGDCFNYQINRKGDSLLMLFADVVPNESNKKEYQQIIEIMKNMNSIDYNQVDAMGVSVVEKILNSENMDLLKLIKNKPIKYSKNLDLAYQNIQNPAVKKRAKLLKMDCDLVGALERNDYNEFSQRISDLANSAFEINYKACVSDIIKFARKSWRNEEKLGIIYQNIQNNPQIPAEFCDEFIAQRKKYLEH